MTPKRTADTMSDAIALSSPSGRMSKRARKQATERLSKALFGEHCTRDDITGTAATDRREQLLRSAQNLRDLAARGMSPRKFINAAEKLEEEAVQS